MRSPEPDAEGSDALAPLELPDEDRVRSPRTGWTRAHWERVADAMLDATRPYASRTQALIHLPGRPSAFGVQSDGLEGFARTFLLAAFRLRGAKGCVVGDLPERYAAGLVAGTSARGPDSWPRHENNGQSLVEAAAIAVALYETRPWIWEQLSEEARSRVVGWLAEVQGKQVWPTNWVLFPVVVNAFLKVVGGPHRQDEIERNLDLADSMYGGDGWYSDGDGRSFDYYTGWGFHFYTLYWARMVGDRDDPGRADVYRERVRRYLVDYRHLFAANGAPLHHGRSLTYRFAVLAPVWAAALAGSTPLAAGETRRLASGTLRYFLERGALRSGVLTQGWHGEYLPAVKGYSGPASPYWASKGFLGLILPADHPVWTAVEEPLAVEQADFRYPVPAAGFLLSGTRADGIVRASTSASDHFPFATEPFDDAHYRKLAYSTHTAPGTGHADEPDLDAQFALEGGGCPSSRRRRFVPLTVDGQIAVTVTYPVDGGRLLPAALRVAVERRLPTLLERRLPCLDVALWQPLLRTVHLTREVRLERIESASIPHGFGAIEIHRVWTPLPRLARAGGFAVAGADQPSTETGTLWARTTNAHGLTSFIAGIHGFDTAAVEHFENANAFGRHAAVPTVRTTQPVEAKATYVTMTLLTTVAPPAAMSELLPTASIEDDRITLTFPDDTDMIVELSRSGRRGWAVRTGSRL